MWPHVRVSFVSIVLKAKKIIIIKIKNLNKKNIWMIEKSDSLVLESFWVSFERILSKKIKEFKKEF